MRRVCVFALAGLALLPNRAAAQSDIAIVLHASGLSAPVAVVQDPTNRAVQFVVEQGGRIRVVQNGTVLGTDFLDLSGAISRGGERGLLGMALSPDYPSSGRFFLNFTNPAGHTVIARFARGADPLVADPSTRFDLRWNGPDGPAYIAQPFANHNGGGLAFGPDGFLYIGMGDGGDANDPGNRAQNPSELLGKMLRVDVNLPGDDAIGYRVPANNPFVSGAPVAARTEIWAFGLRNPWRFSFDDPGRGGTGALVIGDVGQSAWEEVDYEPAGRGGRNYGWRVREGNHDNVISVPPAYQPLYGPIHEYDRASGQSITGGYVYRGAALPNYRGRYFFADYVAGRVWSAGLSIDASGEARATTVTEHTASLSQLGALGNVSSFGTDADGELLIVGYSRGAVLKLVSTGPSAPTGLRIVRP